MRISFPNQITKRPIPALTFIYLLALIVGLGPSSLRGAPAEEPGALGIELEKYEYPFEVKFHEIDAGGQTVKMAYMDVAAKAESEEKGTVVLMHGKNFCGAYWARTARDLSGQGYRVVIPDQIGFGKSSKPTDFQYSFAGLAMHTRGLLETLKIETATVVGHSMGGMLASRFAIMFPEMTERLVLVDPIGLEDWADKGVPYRGIAAWYERELKKDAESIKQYQLESYYHGQWKPEYQEWVDVLAGMAASEDYPQLAKVQAQTYDMIYTQPVVHDFPRIKAPALILVGELDRTALGKDLVDESLREQLGRYPELAREAAAAMPNGEAVVLEGIGHLPHVEAYAEFREALENFLAGSDPEDKRARGGE